MIQIVNVINDNVIDINMPLVYVRKDLYDELVKLGFEPREVVNKLLEEFLEEKKAEKRLKDGEKE